MGSLCSKEQVVEEEPPVPPNRLQKAPSQSLKQLITVTAKEESAVVVAPVVHRAIGRSQSTLKGTSLIKAKPQPAVALPVPAPVAEKKAPVVVIASLNKSYSTAGPTHHRRATVDAAARNPVDADEEDADADADAAADPDLHGVPQGFSGEHVIAGWPTWLTSVAGEVVHGWLPRRADTFERLDKIGQGTYSNVYKARDLQSGKIVALKRVRFVNMDPESVRFMAREIHILRRLDHPNVIRLEGIVTSRLSHSLYLVFEYMEHDLAGLAATPGLRFTEPQVKCFMKQILDGLHHCHGRGVLHRDIKGSNLLIDDNGVLKLADFGLATFFDPAKARQLTSRVVTLWYRPPELLLGATEYGVAVDLWSTGCILAELLAGKPIMPGQTEIEQLHKIFKLCGSPSEDYWAKAKLPDVTLFKPQRPYRRRIAETFRDFPPTALDLLDTLLAIEPSYRGTAASALDSEFFRTKPLACDPSSLPKYPPSKEYDAKLRGKEAMRQNAAAAMGGKGSLSVKPERNEPTKAVPAQDPMGADHQRRQMRNNPKSSSHHYTTLEDSVPGFRMEPPAAAGLPSTMQSAGQFGSTWYRKDGPRGAIPRTTSSSRLSGNPAHLTSQRSYAPSRGTDLHPSSSATRNTNSKYNRLDVAEPANALDRPAPTNSNNKKDMGMGMGMGMRDGPSAGQGYARNPRRMNYSGPLVPPGGNMDEMLKEHERQIQQAVRKARVDKERTTNRPNQY
ncbi:probable serine/threonine-protein kinase At1g54610 [Lolium rigidum]|uniref:probable serine/threonine-protein kinase At1g54610 n=1 Tax=Lolium rigidum TaxID=89674 RepID=UPI001F5C9449|nr:probable serine/threonine-protein kinase At1g54610 [Lolium rigidum]